MMIPLLLARENASGDGSAEPGMSDENFSPLIIDER